MRFEFDGAIATAIRPYGFFGKPLLFSGVISFHVFPPSFERNNPLPEGAFGPSPPERKVHPLRRKSQRAANITFESFGSTTTVEQPAEILLPLSATAQLLPSSDFHTPPLAAPTNSVILPEGSFTPARAEMRPLIVADPMLRAPRPEIVAELYGASSAPKVSELTRLKLRITKIGKRIDYFEAG